MTTSDMPTQMTPQLVSSVVLRLINLLTYKNPANTRYLKKFGPAIPLHCMSPLANTMHIHVLMYLAACRV